MDKNKSYLWREVSFDNWWRIQTSDPMVKKKLKRRQKSILALEGLNHPIVVYRIQYSSPQKAKQSFRRLTGCIVQKGADKGLFYAETNPILNKNNKIKENSDNE
tara:strand:+ start:384 stop:695 length:312 start_codon:yes stop_codon:yes gene_type:complete